MRGVKIYCDVNFMKSTVISIGEICFAESINMKIVVLARITNKMLPKVFLNIQTVEYIGYDYLTENLHLED